MFVNPEGKPNAQVRYVTEKDDKTVIHIEALKKNFAMTFTVATDHPLVDLMVDDAILALTFEVLAPEVEDDGLSISDSKTSSQAGTNGASTETNTPPQLSVPTQDEIAALGLSNGPDTEHSTVTLEELVAVGAVSTPGFPARGMEKTRELLGLQEFAVDPTAPRTGTARRIGGPS